MDEGLTLYMLLLGCKPQGRHTEQHDVFFCIGNSLKAIIPDMNKFWPVGTIHIDAWREVKLVDEFRVSIVPRQETKPADTLQLYFINLGGYKKNEFDEFHYKIIVVASSQSEAIARAKQTAFYKHVGFAGADSHIDDKYGIDIDDVYALRDILPESQKARYKIILEKVPTTATPDEFHLGYTKLSKLK